MTPIDWTVIAVYFAGLIWIVWWSARQTSTSADYFLAGRDVGWFAVGASVFASNIGDRLLAIDTMVINVIGLIMLFGISTGVQTYFEAAMVIAMLGFVSTVAYARFLLRGNIIE